MVELFHKSSRTNSSLMFSRRHLFAAAASLTGGRLPLAASAQEPTQTSIPEGVPTVYDPVAFAADVLSNLDGFHAYPINWYLNSEFARTNRALPDGDTTEGWQGTIKTATFLPDDSAGNGQGFSAGYYLTAYWFDRTGQARDFMASEIERIVTQGIFLDRTGEIKIGSERAAYYGSFQSTESTTINRSIAVWRRGNVVSNITSDFYSTTPEESDFEYFSNRLRVFDRALRYREVTENVTSFLPVFGRPDSISTVPVVWDGRYLPRFAETEQERASKLGFAGEASLYLTASYNGVNEQGAPFYCFGSTWNFGDSASAQDFFSEIPGLIEQSDADGGIDRIDYVEKDALLESWDYSRLPETDLTLNVFTLPGQDGVLLAGTEVRVRTDATISTAAVVDATPVESDELNEEVVEEKTTRVEDESNPLAWILYAFAALGGGIALKPTGRVIETAGPGDGETGDDDFPGSPLVPVGTTAE